jgi:hypothetical protein
MTATAITTSARYRNAASRWLFWCSLLAYVVCLALPAYRTDYYGKSQDHLGLEALLLGVVGIFAGHFSWVANPLLWLSWLKRGGATSGLAFVFAFLALLAATLFLAGETIAVGSAGEFPYHAAAGFYVWLFSIALSTVAALLYVPSTGNAPSAQSVA